jgi:hypothetical protein
MKEILNHVKESEATGNRGGCDRWWEISGGRYDGTISNLEKYGGLMDEYNGRG